MPLVITTGEPAGIGPDVVIQAAQHHTGMPLVIVADPLLLHERAACLGLRADWPLFDAEQSQRISILPIPLCVPCEPGVLAADNAPYVLRCLEAAARGCLNDTFSALVTGPVHKGIINQAGLPFAGHTELFAALTDTQTVVMTFLTDFCPVGLMTTHLPLREVPDAITEQLVYESARVLLDAMPTYFSNDKPKLAICGLNPHAGEDGHLGREEIDVMAPAIRRLRQEGHLVDGPLSADSLFAPNNRQQYDAILSPYHDQALPVIKALGFGRGTQTTLGLPFLRLSVDHGTALSLAATGQADTGSLRVALEQAEHFVKQEITTYV